LPVIADLSRRLDIAGIIDGLCPIRDIALATHGQVIEVLIANRLTNPAAMVAISSWARAWAVAEVYGIAASSLGDDRLARALDAIAEHVDTIVGWVGATAIDVFGIDVSRLHWEMTSIWPWPDISTTTAPAQLDRVLGRTRDPLQLLSLGHGQVPHEYFRMTCHHHRLAGTTGNWRHA